MLVAHDRWFLEAVGTSVLELEGGRGRFFKGTWSQWRKEQAQRELALGRAIDKQQAEIARMEAFVTRFRAKATKARQAQSRVKALNKIERIERDPRDGKGLAFAFKPPERTGRVIFELEDGTIEVPGRTLLEHGELWLERGEHVSLVGPNGAGKTTLIETLAGRRPLVHGKLRTGHNLKVGYLSQHAEELGAGNARTVLEAAVKRTGLTPNAARSLLGRFLFSGEDAEKPLDGLSGGERRRLSLAVLVASGANVLILDEPTNHLDLESREALEDALKDFQGSLLLVSHDRALLDAVGTPHDRLRGRGAALLRRRLGGIRARARGAQAARPVSEGRQAPERRREGGRAVRRPRPTATPRRASRRTSAASRPRSSARSRRPSRRSPRSRPSSATRRPGRTRTAPPPRPAATPTRSAASRSSTPASRRLASSPAPPRASSATSRAALPPRRRAARP